MVLLANRDAQMRNIYDGGPTFSQIICIRRNIVRGTHLRVVICRVMVISIIVSVHLTEIDG